MSKFFNGDRVKITSISVGEESLFSVGNIGTVVYVRTDFPIYYVKLDEDQNVTEQGNYMYTQLSGQDCRFVYAFEADQLQFIVECDVNYYKPGENGWIPDRLMDGIDVMKITAELVSVQVGK